MVVGVGNFYRFLVWLNFIGFGFVWIFVVVGLDEFLLLWVWVNFMCMRVWVNF